MRRLITGLGMVLATVLGQVNGQNINSTYRIIPASERPGLDYEKMLPLRLQHADWTVTVFIEMGNFLKNFPDDGGQITGVHDSCSRVNSPIACHELLRTEFINDQLARAKSLTDELRRVSSDTLLVNKEPEAIPLHIPI